jgi:hypothetical protein
VLGQGSPQSCPTTDGPSAARHGWDNKQHDWNIWQIFKNSEYGLDRFEVTAPSALPQQQRLRLTFRLLQWRWRLVAVTLPENIQKLLGMS